MNRTRFILEGFCNGSYPVDGVEEIKSEMWYLDLVAAIKENRGKDAEEIANKYITASYDIDSIPKFADNDFVYLETLSKYVTDPIVDAENDHEVALFRWITAEFLIEGPTDIVESWTDTLSDGIRIFSQEAFDEWLFDDESFEKLQDGCRYNLGSAWYDLEGFGENGCTVQGESVVTNLAKIAFSPTMKTPSPDTPSRSTRKHLTGPALLEKVKQQGDRPKDDIVRECGYYKIDPDGRETLFHEEFFEALMKAKGF
jgi:hypothetical protein